MLIQECVSVGFKELLANKVRSFLSVFGIIIGIVALIIMMAIMAGIENVWIQYTEEMGGIEKAAVTSKVPVLGGHSREDLKQPLTLDDAVLIKQSPLIRYVSAEIEGSQHISYQGRKDIFVQITGSSRDTLKVNRQRIDKGRFLSEEDLDKYRNVCVLGTGVRDKLFGPHEDPVGRTVEIGDRLFEVVGLLKKNVLMRRKRNLVSQKNEAVYLPATVSPGFIAKNRAITQIQYAVRRRRDIRAAEKEVIRLMAQAHRVEDDVKVQTQEEAYLKTKKTYDIFKLSFSVIAGISLVVGGIGIMNIMIASIAQRVREIGIRKAVGAKFHDILVQFLVETVVVSILGGLLGILLSFIFVYLIRIFVKELDPLITAGAVFLAAIFSLLVGICFGIYPALKAARLNPIDALRYQ